MIKDQKEQDRHKAYMKEYRKNNRERINKDKREWREKRKLEGNKQISDTVYHIDESVLEENELFYLHAARRLVWDSAGRPWWRDKGKIAGTISPQGYRHIKISINYNKRTLRAHRIRWYQETGELVELLDHEDGNRDNNRIDNIRPATWSQNSKNRRKPKGKYSSDYQGVGLPQSLEFFSHVSALRLVSNVFSFSKRSLVFSPSLLSVQ